jgi:hypothetical protein
MFYPPPERVASESITKISKKQSQWQCHPESASTGPVHGKDAGDGLVLPRRNCDLTHARGLRSGRSPSALINSLLDRSQEMAEHLV